MEFAVSIVAECLTDKICKYGREKLTIHRMEQALTLLDPLSEVLIKKMLKCAVRKTPLAAYNLLDVSGYKT